MGQVAPVPLNPVGAGTKEADAERDLPPSPELQREGRARSAHGANTLRPLSPRELQEVGRTLRVWFDPQAWRRSDVSTRALMARAVHRWVRVVYGLSPRTLIFADDWEDEVWGDFQPETKDVRIHPMLLLRDDPATLLNTLAHENRHAVQYELVEELEHHQRAGQEARLRPEVDWIEVSWWRDATRRYLPYRTDHWKPYFYNPLEVDAREADAHLIDKGFWSADRARQA